MLCFTTQIVVSNWFSERDFTEFEEPAFSVRVEESMSQIISIILWNFERLIANTLIQFLERKE